MLSGVYQNHIWQRTVIQNMPRIFQFSNMKITNSIKMSHKLEYISHQRRQKISIWKVFDFIRHWQLQTINAWHSATIGIQKHRQNQTLMRKWSLRNSLSLAIEIQNDRVTLKVDKAKHFHNSISHSHSTFILLNRSLIPTQSPVHKCLTRLYL